MRQAAAVAMLLTALFWAAMLFWYSLQVGFSFRAGGPVFYDNVVRVGFSFLATGAAFAAFKGLMPKASLT